MFNPQELLVQALYKEPLKRQGKVLMAERDTFKYELRDGNRVVYVGITNDPARREAEHRAEGMDFTRMKIVGNKSTRDGAGQWEADRIDTYKSNHNGNRPKYNGNDSGK